jgi:hypothetical protein
MKGRKFKRKKWWKEEGTTPQMYIYPGFLKRKIRDIWKRFRGRKGRKKERKRMDADGDAVEWRPLCNRNYRCLRLYEMEWGDLDLKDYLVTIAPFGGPIALRRNMGALVAADADSSKNNIEIFSSSGYMLSLIITVSSTQGNNNNRETTGAICLDSGENRWVGLEQP